MCACANEWGQGKHCVNSIVHGKCVAKTHTKFISVDRASVTLQAEPFLMVHVQKELIEALLVGWTSVCLNIVYTICDYATRGFETKIENYVYVFFS